MRAHIQTRIRTSRQRGLADLRVRHARRVGGYALVRAVKPQHVVETGTDKGLGSCVLVAALLRNGSGRLTTIDIDPASGYLIGPPCSAVTDLVLGDSVEALRGLSTPVDLFIHDSNH